MGFNYNIPIRKSWGQNFLIDENTINKIIHSINPNKKDHIIEIGPGRGALTNELAHLVKYLTIIEIDPLLTNELKKYKYTNTKIINKDVLKWIPENINHKYKIVGNLPYNISSPIIFKFLELQCWNKMIIMVQKELADRIISKPNSKDYSRISVMSQTFTNVKRVFNISKNVFHPKPEIESSLIVFLKKNINVNYEKFSQLIKMAFKQRRKKLKNNLINLSKISSINKFSDKRAENISVLEFIKIYNNYIF